jgi:hypothetical protein
MCSRRGRVLQNRFRVQSRSTNRKTLGRSRNQRNVRYSVRFPLQQGERRIGAYRRRAVTAGARGHTVINWEFQDLRDLVGDTHETRTHVVALEPDRVADTSGDWRGVLTFRLNATTRPPRRHRDMGARTLFNCCARVIVPTSASLADHSGWWRIILHSALRG